MIIKTEKDIENLVIEDVWMMDVLRAAEALDLPDWWIGAGFLRNKIWYALENNSVGHLADVDLVYFNNSNIESETDWAYDEHMKKTFPFADWEIRNQARMHYKNGFEPYASTADGISHWVETATCIAVKLKNGRLEFLYCYGIDDLINLVARPIPIFRKPKLIGVFHDRIENKNWREKWPNLKILSGV